MLCMPRMALCGGLMMGVDSMEPNTPPLVMVNVPPLISSTVISPSRARIASRLISASIWSSVMDSALRTTGHHQAFG